MGKRKGMSASVKRQKDKIRKREKRQQQLLPSADVPQDGVLLESAVPCGAVDGAISAPPGNFPGQGSIGFPPIEEKPLARMQASLREKMHSNALSIASSQGSRLCARNGGMAPSPDSPPWVCTSPRVPEPDTVHVSGSAGQAQLDMSSSQGDESSRIQNDAMAFETDFETDFKTDFKTDIETDIELKFETNMRMNTDTNMRMDTDTNMRMDTDTNMRMDTDTNMRMDTDTNMKMNTDTNMKMNTESNVINIEEENECINVDCIENESGYRSERQNTGRLTDAEVPSASESRQQANIKKSIQGSFHQGNLMFGENAGTQCVANSLVALAYHRLKNSKHWQATDMDNVLVMGDELYTYLQRSSGINSRYLLVNELPQFFECFNTVYELKADESLCSLINLSDTEPNYDDFHAYFLLDALRIALSETDGCFVCFRGNTFLIGKTNDQFFTFDSHSRTAEGYMSVNGCSTRVLHESIEDVYNHVLSLALSMGYSEMIDCEITGVNCSISKIEADKKKNDRCSSSKLQLVSDGDDDDDVEVVSTESHKISFRPLSAAKKIELCQTLGISFSNYEEVSEPTVFIPEAEGPDDCVRIQGDGNCFFRAISFCLTGVEDHHYDVRSAICQHLLDNSSLFKTFLRCGESSVENHIAMRNMTQEGAWATEVEILALSHLLNTDVHTYTQNHWVTYSARMVDPTTNLQCLEAIYLFHENENHYSAVLSVFGKQTPCCKKTESIIGHKEFKKRVVNRNRMREMRNVMSSEKIENERNKSYLKKTRIMTEQSGQKVKGFCRIDKKLKAAKLKYWTDRAFRLKAISQSKERYRSNEAYNAKSKKRSVEKYALDPGHKLSLKEASRRKYATNEAHRKHKIRRYIEKYKSNILHRETEKQKSTEKYKKDQIHRADVKKRSTDKYNKDEEHRTDVKRRSTDKYKKDEEHRADVKRRSTDKYKKDEEHRADVKRRSTDKYKKDEEHRADVKRRSTDKYKKDEDHRYMLKAASKIKYHFSADGKKRKKENVLKQRQAIKVKLEDEDEVVKLFKDNVRNGPEYTCCCCHRLLFENQVQGCAFEMYEKKQKAMEIAKICINNRYVHECTMSCSTNCKKSSLWICFTCHRKILSGKIPGEAAANKMTVEDIPHQLSNLNSLEQHLIALHIPFMKVMSLPQGGQRNVHGPVVCVPSNMRKATSLPRNENENMLLRVKLKRKLSYKGYFEYQFVNPEHIQTAMDYLKKNNRWYRDVVINSTWKQNCEEGDLILNGSNESEEEELRLEQTEIQEVVSDTCLQPVDIAQEVLDHYFDDVYNIAPGEGQNPVRMLQEEGNEAKTFPHLFPSGNFSWNQNREEKITLARYFNNRLMNTDNRFAKDTNYIFFSQYMSELNQVIEKTQISIRKSVSQLNGGKAVTSDMLQDPEVLSNLLKNNEALRFMQPIRGTPAYWSATQKDLFAMLRQLGIPTWFCSFSAAEFRWNDIVGSILRHENDTTDPSNLDWAEKSEILRKNPVTVARMFENRFHIFQRDVILSPSNPIGNVIDYFIRVEFQQRGSPHMHCLYWVENAPKFNVDSDETVCDFIDRYVTCALPTDNENQELRQIVLAVQQHSKSHSKSCRKKGTECRFNFPRPPSEKTFITKQCEEEDDISDDDRIMKKSQAKDILMSVWNEVLDDVNALKTTEEIFSNIHLTQDVYEIAHKLLSTRTSTILRRNPNEMWTNQYNPCLHRCWDANMDIQYVLDPFSCIVYIISYISKAEREMGMLLKQTQVEAIEGNLSARQTMRTIGSAYLNQREVSAQEAVYRVCNLRMKESSRKVVFVPVGENPTRLSKPLSQMQNKKRNDCNDENLECDDDEEDIWMTNIVERYENRPDLHLFDKMCLAEFCSYYRVLAKSQIPKGENENVYELKNGKGYIQKRTRGKPAVIRYPRFNPENTPEKYYQSVLQLFLPYDTQDQLKPPGFELYQTFFETGFVRLKSEICLQPVKTLVEGNQSKFSKNEEAFDNAQEVFELYGEPEDAWAKLCPETEMNRKECLDEKKMTEKLEDKKPEVAHDIENNFSDLLYHITENCNSRQEMLPLLRRLNEKQKEVFYIIRDWCLKKVTGENMEPLHIFVTGGAGTGKSHLINVIHYEASRILEKLLSSPNDISVLLTSFTGTAAFNIRGNTLHHAFSLPIALRIPYEPLNEQNLSAIRSKLEKLQILIIDEISMVHKRLLYYIHERLVQIKKCKEPFGGVSILAVGDFYQLPPVKQRKAERLYNENEEYPVDYWLDFFKLVELDEIMRQREDANFASILNSLRIRTIEEPLSEKAKLMLSECVKDGPDDVLHVYPTNEEANEHNLKILKEKCGDLIEVNAEDYQKDKTTGKLTLREKPFIRTRTDGLSSSLLISVNARVMLTRNINVDDGLVNGAMGHISSIEFGKGEQRNRVEGIGVIFDSKDTGRKEGKLTPQGHLVYIQRVQEDIREKNKKNVVRRQFPLKLSWACTAHKVQGMTTNSVVVNLDRTFAPGQAYVAISRVTSQNGLFIETSNENALQKKIYADQDVKSALIKMQKLISNQNDGNMINSDNRKTIILFNVQSLRGHFQDLQCDSRFQNTNFICLTETWLKESDNVKDFELQNFEFCHVSREQSYDECEDNFVKLCKAKGGGVGMYKKKNEKTLIHELPQKNVEGMAVELCEENTILIVIYRPSQLSVRVFLDSLQKVLDYFKEQFSKCIIMGDFNEDAKCKGPIQELIESKGFQQKVNFSTTEGGTILDHVYVPELVQADVQCMPVYFSYHEAIKLTFELK